MELHPILRKIFVLLTALSIIVTLGFIYSNSLVSKEDSAGQSSEIVDLTKPIVDPEDKISYNTFQHYVRKSAHFCEYFLLGFEFFALLLVVSRERSRFTLSKILLTVLFPLVAALIDETLQVFSERGAGVVDVWLDFFGAVSGSILCALVFFVFYTRHYSKFR